MAPIRYLSINTKRAANYAALFRLKNTLVIFCHDRPAICGQHRRSFH